MAECAQLSQFDEELYKVSGAPHRARAGARAALAALPSPW